MRVEARLTVGADTPKRPLPRQQQPLSRQGQRRALGGYAAVVAAAWLALTLIHYSPYAGYFGHEVLGQGAFAPPAAVGLFTSGWLLMIVAMMVPAALPTLAHLLRGHSVGLTAVWLAGILAPWALLGFVFAAGDLVVHSAVAPRYPLLRRWAAVPPVAGGRSQPPRGGGQEAWLGGGATLERTTLTPVVSHEPRRVPARLARGPGLPAERLAVDVGRGRRPPPPGRHGCSHRPDERSIVHARAALVAQRGWSRTGPGWRQTAAGAALKLSLRAAPAACTARLPTAYRSGRSLSCWNPSRPRHRTYPPRR